MNERQPLPLLSGRIEPVPACTRPFPINGPFHQPTSNRVHVNVFDGRRIVRFAQLVKIAFTYPPRRKTHALREFRIIAACFDLDLRKMLRFQPDLAKFDNITYGLYYYGVGSRIHR